MKEKSLSDKIFSNFYISTPKDTKLVKNVILAQDIKEAVRMLKEKMFDLLGHETGGTIGEIDSLIDNIFGEKLI